MKESKAQSAVEYLMSYGWMLLVVAVVGGAIFSITESQNIESSSGFSGSDISVENFGLNSDGELDMVLRNTAADSVEINDITLTQDGEKFTTSIDKEINVGDSSSVSSVGTVPSSESNNIDVSINYDNGGLQNLTTTGSTTGNLEIIGRQAEGGQVSQIKRDNEYYRIHAFTDVGESTFQVKKSGIQADILIVGGGGGGSGGGGGAGGVKFEQGVELNSSAYDVSVGRGGTGAIPSNSVGENGEESLFSTLSVEGGGGAGRIGGGNGKNGGSGGGAGHDCGVPGNATNQSYGNRGGDSNVSDCGGVGAAGGGGAGSRAPDGGSNLTVDSNKLIGAVDRNNRLPNGGYGGLGKDFSTYFGSNVGENGYFGGGGAGGINYNGGTIYSRTPGGLGGGGDGAGADGHNYDQKAEGLNGMENTGGGGGGSDWEGGSGGDGGSGIVVIRLGPL